MSVGEHCNEWSATNLRVLRQLLFVLIYVNLCMHSGLKYLSSFSSALSSDALRPPTSPPLAENEIWEGGPGQLSRGWGALPWCALPGELRVWVMPSKMLSLAEICFLYLGKPCCARKVKLFFCDRALACLCYGWKEMAPRFIFPCPQAATHEALHLSMDDTFWMSQIKQIIGEKWSKTHHDPK